MRISDGVVLAKPAEAHRARSSSGSRRGGWRSPAPKRGGDQASSSSSAEGPYGVVDAAEETGSAWTEEAASQSDVPGEGGASSSAAQWQAPDGWGPTRDWTGYGASHGSSYRQGWDRSWGGHRRGNNFFDWWCSYCEAKNLGKYLKAARKENRPLRCHSCHASYPRAKATGMQLAGLMTAAGVTGGHSLQLGKNPGEQPEGLLDQIDVMSMLILILLGLLAWLLLRPHIPGGLTVKLEQNNNNFGTAAAPGNKPGEGDRGLPRERRHGTSPTTSAGGLSLGEPTCGRGTAPGRSAEPRVRSGAGRGGEPRGSSAEASSARGSALAPHVGAPDANRREAALEP